MIYKKYFFIKYLPGGDSLVSHGLATIGVSFIIFRQISWALHKTKESFVCYLSYLFNFTTFLAGPVQEPHAYISELNAPSQKLDTQTLLSHLSRLTTGLVKKYLLCDLLLIHSLPADIDLQHMTGLAWLCASYVWFLYLYLDFSGYCDIIISVAALMGLRLPENFKRPFLARNLSDFWSRWHITLSTWIKNYVYTPLSRMFVGRFGVAHVKMCSLASIFVSFFMMGLWHGSQSKYIVFGLTQAVGVAICYLWEILLKKKLSKEKFKAYKKNMAIRVVAILITLQYMALSLTLIKNEPHEVWGMICKLWN
jgi:D-alanyl-lipoteichoic acid acyltransferase DltB (MBOAT superfamily)